MNVTLTKNTNAQVAHPTPCSSPIPFSSSNPTAPLPFPVAKNTTGNQPTSLITCKIGAGSDSVRNPEAESNPLLIPSRPSISVASGQSLLQLATPLASPIIATAEKTGAPGEASRLNENVKPAQSTMHVQDTIQNDHQQSTNANEADLELSNALMSFAKSITSTSTTDRHGDVTREESPAPATTDSSPSTDSADKSAESLSAPVSPSSKTCFSCGTRSTPLWRRSVEGNTVCNACGLYLKSNKTERPAWLKKRLEEARFTIGPDGTLIGNSKCVNCGVTSTPLWRRDGEGNLNCNACGLYYKLHNAARPLDIIKSKSAQKRSDQLMQAPNHDQTKSEPTPLTSSSLNFTPSSSQHHQMELLRQRKRQRELELLHYQQLQERQTMHVYKYQHLQYNMSNSSRDHSQQYSLIHDQEHHQPKRRRSGSEDHDLFKINKSFRQSGLRLQLPPLVSRSRLVEAPFSHHTRPMGNDQCRRTSMDDTLSSRKLGLAQDQHPVPTKATNSAHATGGYQLHPNTPLQDSLSSARSSASRSPPTPNHYHGYIPSAYHEEAAVVARDINYDDQHRSKNCPTNPACGQQRRLPSIHSFLHSHGLKHRGSH